MRRWLRGMGGWICACLWLMMPMAAWALPMTQAEVRELLSAEPAQRARFEQEKQVEGLARPLTASGELLLVRGQVLWWHQLQPFELADGSRQRLHDAWPAVHGSARPHAPCWRDRPRRRAGG